MKKISDLKDSILNKNYQLFLEDAKTLSENLKSILSKMDINPDDFNSSLKNENIFNKDNSVENPPVEIYEYQNFFILELDNKDVVLLDGFRRLLWYNTPNIDVMVRKYKKSDLTDQEILTLLVNLNHFKFHGGSAYHERGFSLLLKTIFDLNIVDIKSAFDGYLSKKSIKSVYGSGDKSEVEKQGKNDLVKERIVSEHFISNIRFLSDLNEKGYMCNKFVGSLLFIKQSESKQSINFDKFIELADKNPVLKELTDKYKKSGDNGSSKSMEYINKIIEIYQNIFTLMSGGDVELSFAEKQSITKKMVTDLKKDKQLVKITGSQSVYKIESLILKMIENGETPEFKCVVHPSQTSSWNNKKPIPYGVYDKVELVGHRKRHLGMGATDPVFELKVGDESFEMWHTHNGGYGGGFSKKYTNLNNRLSKDYLSTKIDLFVKIDKKLLK